MLECAFRKRPTIKQNLKTRCGPALEKVVFQSESMQPRLQTNRTGERAELAQVARIDQLLIADLQNGAVIGNDGKLVEVILIDTQVTVPGFDRAMLDQAARGYENGFNATRLDLLALIIRHGLGPLETRLHRCRQRMHGFRNGGHMPRVPSERRGEWIFTLLVASGRYSCRNSQFPAVLKRAPGGKHLGRLSVGHLQPVRHAQVHLFAGDRRDG